MVKVYDLYPKTDEIENLTLHIYIAMHVDQLNILFNLKSVKPLTPKEFCKIYLTPPYLSPLYLCTFLIYLPNLLNGNMLALRSDIRM